MKQHDLFIQNYMEFIEENELEDNQESIDMFLMSLIYEIRDNIDCEEGLHINDVESMSLTQIEEQITYVLKNKKKTTWESSL